MFNIFEADHGGQRTTREGGPTVFGSKNKICFLALFSHTDGICGGNCNIKDVKQPWNL